MTMQYTTELHQPRSEGNYLCSEILLGLIHGIQYKMWLCIEDLRQYVPNVIHSYYYSFIILPISNFEILLWARCQDRCWVSKMVHALMESGYKTWNIFTNKPKISPGWNAVERKSHMLWAWSSWPHRGARKGFFGECYLSWNLKENSLYVRGKKREHQAQMFYISQQGRQQRQRMPVLLVLTDQEVGGRRTWGGRRGLRSHRKECCLYLLSHEIDVWKSLPG